MLWETSYCAGKSCRLLGRRPSSYFAPLIVSTSALYFSHTHSRFSHNSLTPPSLLLLPIISPPPPHPNQLPRGVAPGRGQGFGLPRKGLAARDLGAVPGRARRRGVGLRGRRLVQVRPGHQGGAGEQGHGARPADLQAQARGGAHPGHHALRRRPHRAARAAPQAAGGDQGPRAGAGAAGLHQLHVRPRLRHVHGRRPPPGGGHRRERLGGTLHRGAQLHGGRSPASCS